jgi:CheY-like chemotaxis protein
MIELKYDKFFVLKSILALVVLIFALIRFLFFDMVGERIDETFIMLLVVAAIILFLPWERLTLIKAGGFEFTIDKPEILGALEGFVDISRVENKQLLQLLKSREEEIRQVKGSRILWIDDKPHNVVGERRILRAIGAEVISAISSDIAEEILNQDNDFDIIISDVQRRGEHYKLVSNGVEIHDGVNFIVKLRQNNDPVIKSLPVIFYAAYDIERLIQFTKPAKKYDPKPEISRSIEDLLEKVIVTLSDVRSNPIKVKARKSPTRV